MNAVAGHGERAPAWAGTARTRNPDLNREHFFRAFPMRDPVGRARVDQALKDLGL